jgi:hypothetical protein
MELDRCHDYHDQGHDEGDGVEIEWHWTHGACLMDWWAGLMGWIGGLGFC